MRATPLLLAILLALAGPARAEGLARLDTAEAMRGLEGIGRLDMASGRDSGFCTATLVAPTLVLTAAHCVHREDGTPHLADEMTFRAGLRDGHADAVRRVRRMIVHPAYRPEPRPTFESVSADLALLELDAALELPNVRPFPASGRLGAGDRVRVVSYARHREDAPSDEADCGVLERDARILVLTCSVDFGASGAPVLIDDGRGPTIVSVISAKGEWDGRPAAFAVTVEEGLSLLVREFARAPMAGASHKSLRVGAERSGTIRFVRPGQ